MPGSLDHMILAVNDRDESLQFYTEILGLPYTGEREMFAVVRASPECVLQLAPWGTPGGVHLAFSFSREDFDAAFSRIREAGLPYGDVFDGVGNQKGPGVSGGAHGESRSLYCFDPNQHLIELLYYED